MAEINLRHARDFEQLPRGRRVPDAGSLRMPITHREQRLETPEPGGSREMFIRAMRGAVSGVNVVTTDGPAGRYGLTVSAFASVSADPPTVLVCINQASPVAAAVRDNGCFCVNVLSTEQREVADTFAGRPRSGRPYNFSAAQWARGVLGTPRLLDAVAQLECTVSGSVAAGTHSVVFGSIVATTIGGGSALLYRDRQYGRACTQ